MALHDHASMKRHAERGEKEKLHRLAGGGHVGEKHLVDGEIKKAMGEHDAQQHGGKKTKIKLKAGGEARVEGEHGRHRGDRPDRKREHRAEGGGVHHKGKDGKGSKGTHVNVIVAPGAGGGGPAAGMGPPGMPPRPPMAPPMAGPPPGGPPTGGPPPGAGGPPPGMPPRPPMAPPPGAGGPPGMMPHKRGGRAEHAKGGVIEHGAGGGSGRLEKMAAYGNKPHGENRPDIEEFENKANTSHEENRPKVNMKKGGCA